MRSRLNSFVAVILAAVVAAVLSATAAAQQVTYYDFDQATASYTCTPTSAGGSLFCFNNQTTGTANPNLTFPRFLLGESYPANLDPDPSDNPPVASNHTALQIADGTGEYSSAWFSVPQKVSNGFTVYVAFRLAPVPSFTAGDGIAFVIQNASGGGVDNNNPSDGNCSAFGSGLTVGANIGACLGYGAIDNSVAVEFDTFQNNTSGFGDPNANHIAIKSCGLDPNPPHAGLPNSPNHSRCAVGPIASTLASSLTDGNAHQAVIEYSGPNEIPANQWTVYLDPQFLTGTHTPDPGDPGSAPIITTTAAVTGLMNLQNSGSANDSAYVGFTGASGGAASDQQILAWTYTPHTPVTQDQPISDPGTPTTFNYGQHTFANEYTTPPDDGTTNTTDMIVVANTITPVKFGLLIAGTSFAGSDCQQYEGTGGNCIIYSVYCVDHAAPHAKKPCPSTDNPTIAVKTAYESTGPGPTAPGFLQGDPFYSQISSISASGRTVTVNCAGECAVSDQEVVSIRDTGNANLDAENVVASVPPQLPPVVDSFTYQVSFMGSATATAGYVTSNNVTNICNVGTVTPTNPLCWQAQKIDGTQSGKTKNFSDLVALFNTVGTTSTTVTTNDITYGQIAHVTVHTAPSGPIDNVSLAVDDGSPVTQALSGGETIFDLPGLSAGTYTLTASHALQTVYSASTGAGSLTVAKANPTVHATGGTFTFDGNPHPATGTVTGVNGEDLGAPVITYDGGSSTPPSSAGPHTVLASYGGNTNYNPGSDTTTISIGMATPTVNVTGGTFPYDGNPHPATGSVMSGSTNLGTPTFTYNGVSTVPVNAGTYTVVASFAGDSNYAANTNTTTITISQVLPTVTVSGGSFIYDGQPHAATGSVTGVSGSLGAPVITYNGLAAVPVNPGSYAVLGTYGGSTNYLPASATNTITIGASITVTPGGLDFGIVNLGSSKSLPLTVKNISSTSLTVTKISFTYGHTGSGSNYGYTTQCGGALKPGKTCTITVTLKAQDVGPGTALLNVAYNQPGAPAVVSLSGTVINPKTKLSVSSLSFGTVKVGQNLTKTVTLTSIGDTDLLIGSIVVTGSSDFTTTTCPAVMPKNTACNITVTFSPSAKQSRTGTLKITDNASSSPQTVSLTGKGN